jgi:hypothetical protein
MGLLDQFTQFAKTPEGQGLLSAAFGGLAGARRGQPLNSLGRAGMAGLQGFGAAQDRQAQEGEAAFQQQLRTAQMEDMQSKRAKEQAQQQWRTQLPGLLTPKLQGETEQSRMLAAQMGPDATPEDVNAMNSGARMPQAGFSFAPDKQALDRHMMDANSPFADKLLEQQLFPKADDYRVVGSDLVKIGKGGVSVEHKSERPENIPAELKIYRQAQEQGYTGSFMDFKAALVSNAEGAKASFDPMTITSPGGATTIQPRSTVMREAGGGSAPARPGGNFTSPGYSGGSSGAAAVEQRAILTRELEAAQARGSAEDVAGLQRELARLPGGAPGLQVQSKADEAAAVERAKLEAKAGSSENQSAKAAQRASIQAQIAVIDKAIAHPGRKTATGLSGVLDPRNYTPGTDARDFRVVLDQLGGAAFLQAFESLKGGGQITEVEGKKATEAIARLNRAQSDSEFEVALNDLRGVMKNGYDRLGGGGGASGSFDEPKAGKQFDSKPPAHQHQGKTLRGPDGKRYKSDGMMWKEVQ